MRIGGCTIPRGKRTCMAGSFAVCRGFSSFPQGDAADHKRGLRWAFSDVPLRVKKRVTPSWSNPARAVRLCRLDPRWNHVAFRTAADGRGEPDQLCFQAGTYN